MESKFTIGDVVQLKSGGPEMTISDNTTKDAWDGSVLAFNGIVSTTWFEKSNQKGGSFHQDMLELIDED